MGLLLFRLWMCFFGALAYNLWLLGDWFEEGCTIPGFHVLDNYLSMKDLVHHKFIIYTSSQIGLHKIITRNNENWSHCIVVEMDILWNHVYLCTTLLVIDYIHYVQCWMGCVCLFAGIHYICVVQCQIMSWDFGISIYWKKLI